jgi:hypothetical protein
MAQRTRLRLSLGVVRKAQRDAVNRAGRLAVEHILGESRKEVPIEEGTLERSGVAQWDDQQQRGAISYDTPYAVRQHEDMALRHDDGRKAKYLEDPMEREADAVRDIFAAELRRALR